jgi:hypothetical protein
MPVNLKNIAWGKRRWSFRTGTRLRPVLCELLVSHFSFPSNLKLKPQDLDADKPVAPQLRITPMNQTEPGTRDGFRLTRDRFTVPKDSSHLDPKTKRAITICNLFVNHKLSLGDIVRLLDEDSGRVVLALLELGIVHDRRNKPRPMPAEPERRKSIVSLRTESH